MEQIHLPRRCRFHSDKFLPTLIYASAGVRAFLLCLEPGQGLPPRADSEEVLCYLIEGRARVTRAGEVVALEAGDFIAIGAGQVRAIEAEERSVVLWIHIADRQHG